MLDKALKRPLFRYVFIGGLTYIIDIAILVGLYAGLHTTRALAASASFWVGLLISFLLQKLVAFQDYQKEIRAISKQIVWYAVLVAFNYSLTVVIVSLFPGRYIILSRTIALAITTCWNFLVYKRLVFKTSSKGEPL
ncbi:MAG TPA: GtrA family protein [Candidatus Saccharimonadales bacterium]|nr:GtrA family protein [Candidatus Saccharimonadales bacterium]